MDPHGARPDRASGESEFILDLDSESASTSTIPPAMVEQKAVEAPAGLQQRRSQRRRLLLLAGGAVALAGVVAAGIYTPTALRIAQQKDVTLEAPAEAAGLRRDTSDQATNTSDYLRTALAVDLGLGTTMGAVYVDGSQPPRTVIIVGGTALLRFPEKDLDKALELLADDASRVEGIRSVPPGPLGGVMKCGTASDLSVCGWSDHGSVAIAMFPGRGVDESAGLLRDLRGAIQHRR